MQLQTMRCQVEPNFYALKIDIVYIHKQFYELPIIDRNLIASIICQLFHI